MKIEQTARLAALLLVSGLGLAHSAQASGTVANSTQPAAIIKTVAVPGTAIVKLGHAIQEEYIQTNHGAVIRELTPVSPQQASVKAAKPAARANS